MALEFEEILPYVEGEGDTGKTAREKINRNFTKIEPLANVGAEMQQLRQDVSDDLEQLHDDVEEMVDKTTSLFGYYNCSTAGATAAKTVQATGYELTTGGNTRIKMEHANTAASPVTLQIGNAAAKELYYNDEPVSSDNTWEDNEVVVVYYDGTKYSATNSLGGGGSNNGDAENIHYDNTESGLSATNVQDALDGIADKTQRLTTLDSVSPNLVIDPDTTVERGYYTAAGALVTTGAGGNFNHTDFIPVEYGKTYKLYAPLSDGTQGSARFIAAFNENKVGINGAGDESKSVYTVTNSNVKYIVISGRKEGSKTLFGCFEGENAPFEEWHEESRQLQYNDGISFADKDNDTLVNKRDVMGAVVPLQEGIEELQEVKNVADMFEVYSDVSPNLVVNPSTTIEPGYYALDGTYTGDGSFAHTDFIRIDPEKTYTVCAPIADGTRGYARFVTAFDENKQPFTGSQNAGGDRATQYSVPANYRDRVRYIVISGRKEGSKTLFGCFEGEGVDFEEWHETVQTVLVNDEGGYDNKPLNAIVTKSDVIRAIEESKSQPAADSNKVQFKYEVSSTHSQATGNPAITIHLDDATNNYILVALDKARNEYYRFNHILNFLVATYNGVANVISDDVPPLIYYPSSNSRTDYGGNHGSSVTRFKAEGHGLDNTDVGRTFPYSGNSGNFNVVLLRVDGDYLIISKDGNGTYPTTVPNGTVNIDGTDFTISAATTSPSPYLCPAEQNLTQHILIDGKEEVTEDGEYTCDFLDIVEEYDVNMPTEIITALKNKQPNPDNPTYKTPHSLYHVKNTYRFLPNMGCLIFKTFIANTNINVAACMGTQSTYPLYWKKRDNTPLNTEIYIPNSTHNEDTLDFTPGSETKIQTNENDFVAPSTWPANTKYWVFDSNTWADQNNPVNRAVFRTENGNGIPQCGYVVGYDKSMGVGKSLGSFTIRPLNISKKGKFYPYGLSEGTSKSNMSDGDSVSIVMYRMFFRPDLQPQGRICEYHYELNGKLYVYLDYSDSINDLIVIDDKWDNKPIEIVESRNADLLTDMYNGGIRVRSDYKNGETAFMVVRVG